MPCPNCTCSSCLTGSPVVSESVTPDPPTHLGTTNQCPTNSETPYLKGVIERAQEAFAIIDEKSKQARVLLDGLLEQRAQLLVTIDKHKAILSPLRRFPAEILGEIFMAYLALEGMRAPILLAKLCSRWRGTALNTPRLWSKINLYVSPANATRNKNILGAYIPRSGQVPLDVTITSPGWLGDTSGLGDIFQDLLVPQAHRWEHLLIDVSADLHVELAPMLKGRLHSLKSIAFVRSFCHHDKVKLIDCYLGAPKITDVFTAGICHLPLPWPQLQNWKTSVTMDACTACCVKQLTSWIGL
ncbi:hypothetical protein BD779DRAFT_420894 [Infundibulicybe gibba]|nr:hypothetical protein BD779DRAFT_420894 [Infundibulicybe gibba]